MYFFFSLSNIICVSKNLAVIRAYLDFPLNTLDVIDLNNDFANPEAISLIEGFCINILYISCFVLVLKLDVNVLIDLS